MPGPTAPAWCRPRRTWRCWWPAAGWCLPPWGPGGWCRPCGCRGDVNHLHPAAWPEVRRWGRSLLVLYAALIAGSLALGTTVVLFTWFIPLLVGLPFLRLYLMCEHTLCPNSDDGFANTRTTLSNPIVRFLMWNLPYHAEHHLFPNIAFHNLPEAHRHLRPHLKYIATGYIPAQSDIIRSLRSADLQVRAP